MQSIECANWKRQCASPAIRLLVVLMCCGLFTCAGIANAADVTAKLSSKEAYVGASLTLQIQIQNAEEYELPELPTVKGVEIVREGAPQQSRRVAVVNGRMLQEQSITFLYRVTPTEVGAFEIPAMNIRADGDVFRTEPMTFVATASETGDLLFVEIEGEESSVYVGEPIRLTLKIWLRPYRMADQELTLSEGDMWSMRSSQTEWGEFTKALEDMRAQNQRPGGRSVLREDQNGQSREYYLYEIDAEIYPKKPGKVDAGGVKIVFNYPTEIGPASRRDPFGMGSMFDDDFFRSPFGRPRFAVKKSRPIRAKAEIDAIEVLPIPTEGRPDGYNGAVGEYTIVTQATPQSVEAGDAVKLKIGITGDGPMELVRCPPLSTMPELTADFKVSDQPLPGFVQDNMKVFAPTIRPKYEGVTEIPSIEFHFFNPKTESFEVAKSEPIPLRVKPSETLKLGSIVSNGNRSADSDSVSGAGQGGENAGEVWAASLWQNHTSADALENVPVRKKQMQGWSLIVFPGLVWFSLVVWQNRNRWMTWMPEWKSPGERARQEMELAEDLPAIGQAMAAYLLRQFGTDRESSNWMSGVGGVRATGGYGLAAEVESFIERCQREESVVPSEATVAAEPMRSRGVALIEQLESFREQQRPSRSSRTKPASVLHSRSVARTLGWMIVGWTLASGGVFRDSMLKSFAMEIAPANRGNAVEPLDGVTLDQTSMSVLFQEANQAYERGMSMLEMEDSRDASTKDLASDLQSGRVDAKAGFALAATRYQTLVDAGVENPWLYSNLGNACLQSGQIGRAIAAYENALKWNPENDSIRTRLWLARDQVNESSDHDLSWELWAQRAISPVLFKHWGSSQLRWTVIALAVVFWVLLISLRIGQVAPETRRVARSMASLLVVVAVGGSVVWWLATSAVSRPSAGYIAADQVTVRTGDADSFPALIEWSNADGKQVEVVQSRGQWMLVRTASAEGWVPRGKIQTIKNGGREILLPPNIDSAG